MENRFAAIANFLKMVEEVKGEAPGITMKAEFKHPGDAAARGAVSRDAGTQKKKRRENVTENEDGSQQGGDPSRRTSSYDGVLHIGEQVCFSVTMPKSGWLRFFNFGSSGRCLRLFPGPGMADRHFRAGESFTMPANGPWFDVNGPATTEGRLDRLFAILVEEQKLLTLAELDPRLEERSRGSFGGEVEGGKSSPLFALAGNLWEYGLLEYETRDAL